MHGVAANSVSTPGPPTLVSLDFGGDLPTIAEGDNEDAYEDDADGLILETFLTELMDEYELQETDETTLIVQKQDGREEEVRVPPQPTQMMPENILLFMAKSEEQMPPEHDHPRLEQHGSVFLESENLYIANCYGESADEDCTETNDIGQYVDSLSQPTWPQSS